MKLNIKRHLMLLFLIMLLLNSREIDTFKMEEFKFKDHSIFQRE